MEKSSLQRRGDAAILENHFSHTTIVVEVQEKGSVHLAGGTRSEEEREQLLTVVKGVTGVSEVVSDVFVGDFDNGRHFGRKAVTEKIKTGPKVSGYPMPVTPWWVRMWRKRARSLTSKIVNY